MRQSGKIRFNRKCKRLCQQEMTCIEFSMFSEISDVTKRSLKKTGRRSVSLKPLTKTVNEVIQGRAGGMLAEAQTAQHERAGPLPVQLFKRVDGYAKALLCCGAFYLNGAFIEFKIL